MIRRGDSPPRKHQKNRPHSVGRRTDNPFLRGIQDQVGGVVNQNPFRTTSEEHFVYDFAFAFSYWRDNHSGPIGLFELQSILASYCPSCEEPLVHDHKP